MKTFTRAALVFGLLLSALPGAAQTIAPKSCAAQWPSPKQLRDIGLPELSEDQLLALTLLLDRQPVPVAPAAEVVESRIDGDFDGWEGETTFTLENGQVWQQNAAGAKYYFANRPKVRISGSPATLRVEGFAPSVAVRRIK